MEPVTYAWMDVMGGPNVDITAYEVDESLLVSGTTLLAMARTFAEAGLLGEAEVNQHVTALICSRPVNIDDGLFYDVTEAFGGWEQAQQMRLGGLGD